MLTPRRAIRNLVLSILGLMAFATGAAGQSVVISDQMDKVRLVDMLTGSRWRCDDKDRIEMLSAVRNADEIRVKFNKNATTALMTREKFELITDSVRKWTDMPKAKVSLWSENINMATLIPHKWQMPRSGQKAVASRKGDQGGMLTGRTFAIWNSHGRYYEKSLDRWEWQRARLFTTVEDLLSTSFVVPYLVPMLENAGAYVVMPRERDLNDKVLIADNDDDSTIRRNGLRFVEKSDGYARREKIENFDNPFLAGTAETYELKKGDTIEMVLPQAADVRKMNVYVSYVASEKNSANVEYIIKDNRGESRYVVDQRRGGSMWLRLGEHWIGGDKPASVSIVGEGRVSVDAIRAGGGKGVVARNGRKSGMAAWGESARYYLQADGWSKEVYAISGGTNDYTDDINCRGEWVNAMRREKGIDVDGVIALHTDAGVATADTTIGTLTIVSTRNGIDKYADGRSKAMARALAQSIETQIVGDIRATWDTTWSQRGIWDKGYSEAKRADVPSVLVELLSHQNINDMHLALHPRFRHDAARAIYKGIARFYEGDDVVIAPLAVSAVGMEMVGKDSIRLSWSPTVDPLEPSAMPDNYIIKVWHHGGEERVIQTNRTTITLHQPTDGEVSEYSIVAVNHGGKSFPSEPLTARLDGTNVDMLYVDGFDRVSAPDVVDEPRFRGVIDAIEPGVPDGWEILRTGSQYDYDPSSEWLDDDAPGCGASYADCEMSLVVKKKMTPDVTHITQSKEYFERREGRIVADSVVIFLGDQKRTWYGDMGEKHAIWTDSFLNRVEQAMSDCRVVYIYGSNVGSDIRDKATADRIAKSLGFRYRTNHASKMVKCEHPDAIEPANGATTIERYVDSAMSAAIRFKNVIVRGYY